MPAFGSAILPAKPGAKKKLRKSAGSLNDSDSQLRLEIMSLIKYEG
jgi:hypothetical protein